MLELSRKKAVAALAGAALCTVAPAFDPGEPAGTFNTFTAPTAGAADVWAVAHDDRGGQSWVHGTLAISP